LKIGYFASTGSVDPKFQVEGVAPINHSSSQKTRLNDLSYGVKIWTHLSTVLSQFTRVTDGQTDRQTEFPSPYRVYIPCSAVKKNDYLWPTTAVHVCHSVLVVSAINFNRETQYKVPSKTYTRYPKTIEGGRIFCSGEVYPGVQQWSMGPPSPKGYCRCGKSKSKSSKVRVG